MHGFIQMLIKPLMRETGIYVGGKVYPYIWVIVYVVSVSVNHKKSPLAPLRGNLLIVLFQSFNIFYVHMLAYMVGKSVVRILLLLFCGR